MKINGAFGRDAGAAASALWIARTPWSSARSASPARSGLRNASRSTAGIKRPLARWRPRTTATSRSRPATRM